MKQNEKIILPIDSHIPEILEAVKNYSTIIVKASPGSGKTTRLPWALTSQIKQKIAVLEPRRLAAKLAAKRIAEENRLNLGQEIGYHFRFEKNIQDDSKLIFYTEGTFLKKFLNDPYLKDIDLVILDEFHERHLETDLALALLRELQLKKELKIILMSATIETDIKEQFENCVTIEIEAKQHPVEIKYLPNQPSIIGLPLELKVKKTIEETSGDTLVFLPGMREMLKTKEVLSHISNVLLLHADLSKEEQDKALQTLSERKIILATNIAESSLTIPGIKTVIDSGIQRESWYSPWNGLKYIHDVPVTKSSAIQRAGRAGRTGPGVCYRLYSEFDFNERKNYTIPEIDKADLTDICLLVMATGLSPKWPKNPDLDKWQKAIELLRRLGALEGDKITITGKRMIEYPLDSRIARVLISGENLELKSKEKLLKFVCQEIEQDKSGSLLRRLSFYLKSEGNDKFPWEKCLLTGFIDQVAKYRSKQKDFIHFSGKIIKAHHSLNNLEDGFYLILNITQRQEAIQVISVWEEWFWELESFPIQEELDFEVGEQIIIKEKTKIGSIVLEEKQIKPTWSSLDYKVQNKLLIQLNTISLKKIENIKSNPKFEKLSFWALQKNTPIASIMDSFRISSYFSENDQLSWENFEKFFINYLENELGATDIETQLPSKVYLGGKRELIIHYPVGLAPYLEAPIQDFYGLRETPTIMSGKISLTLKLLGPHKRPIQITKDLKSFWEKTYKEMKKEYERDYPRHYWPENPLEAKPFLLKSHLPKA
jgi:ATP-dependent helicase HrpB